MSEKIIIRITHLRKIHACVKLSKVWFKEHDLDWKDFVKNGIDLEILKQIDDIHVKEIIEIVENGD